MEGMALDFVLLALIITFLLKWHHRFEQKTPNELKPELCKGLFNELCQFSWLIHSLFKDNHELSEC
jgi:hypothetical protein